VSTFDDPKHYATGIKHVFVNGKRILADGVMTAERPGRPLRGPGYRPATPRPPGPAPLGR
jgi:N-acyl-D-amino-acid deacylase